MPRTLTAFRLEPELIEAVDRRAEADATTRSDVVRQALRAFTDQTERPPSASQ